MTEHDRVKLRNLVLISERLRNYRATQSAQSLSETVDSLFVQIDRREYEELITLSIEALRNKLKETPELFDGTKSALNALSIKG